MTVNSYKYWRRRKTELPASESSAFRRLSPLQAQHARTIAFEAALEVIG